MIWVPHDPDKSSCYKWARWSTYHLNKSCNILITAITKIRCWYNSNYEASYIGRMYQILDTVVLKQKPEFLTPACCLFQIWCLALILYYKPCPCLFLFIHSSSKLSCIIKIPSLRFALIITKINKLCNIIVANRHLENYKCFSVKYIFLF